MKVLEDKLLPNRAYWVGVSFLTLLSIYLTLKLGVIGVLMLVYPVYLFLLGMGKQEGFNVERKR